MANDLETTRKVSNFKTKKLSSIIDFSALVSLSFLLIMFFMLTSAMQRPQTMDLSLPDSCDDCGWRIGCFRPAYERMITILLDSNDNIVYYHGILNSPYKSTWSTPLLIGLFNFLCCKYTKYVNTFAEQGTSDGEFYTDVCRSDVVPIISFL